MYDIDELHFFFYTHLKPYTIAVSGSVKQFCWIYLLYRIPTVDVEFQKYTLLALFFTKVYIYLYYYFFLSFRLADVSCVSSISKRIGNSVAPGTLTGMIFDKSRMSAARLNFYLSTPCSAFDADYSVFVKTKFRKLFNIGLLQYRLFGIYTFRIQILIPPLR